MARRPTPPRNPDPANPIAAPAVVTTTGPAAGVAGAPHTPSGGAQDPRAVTTAGQVRSPDMASQYPGAPSAQQPNAAWGALPVLTDGMTFWEIGQTGLRQFSGWVREEFLQTLVGRQGAQKYREMMDNSPTIGGLLFAIQSTMRKVTWRVNPDSESAEGGGSQEQADFIEGCMHDMSHSWADHVVEALSMLPFGFSFHEIVYKKRSGRDPGPDPRRRGEDLPQSAYDDGKIGWRRLPGRSQDTLIKWFFDENGTTKGVTQQPWVGPLIDIPIEKSLLFRPAHYKANPEGRSILRNAYVPYYYTKRLQEQEAILFERLGGVPVIKVPGQLLEAAAAGDPTAVAAVNAYKRIAINLRTDEQMGLVLPSDVYPGPSGSSSGVAQYQFELVSPQMRSANINMDSTVQRYSVAILTSVLADFLTLGHEARGTQSLAVSKIDLFFQAIEGYLNSNAEIYNRYAIPRLMELNAVPETQWPKLEPDLAQRIDLDVLSNFVLRLSQAGMPLFPDEDLQSYLKDAAGLPDIDDSLALQAAGLLPEQLDLQDEMKETQADNLKNPPAPAGGGGPGKPAGGGGGGAKGPPKDAGGGAQRTQKDLSRENLEKMIAAALANRMIRQAGPRFGIVTKQGGRKRRRSQAVNLNVR